MAPYAKTEVTLILLLGGVVTVLVALFLGYAWAIIPAVLALALLSFYRDPPRRIPVGDDLLVSPADGKIVDVTRNYDAGDGSTPVWRIGIFLSVANVHLNRSPCSGRVTDVKYTPGKFLNALKPESATENENNVLTLEPEPPIPGPIRVRQISGALARRIVCKVEAGEALSTGDRFGMIKLGSRTEIYVPEDPRWEIAVRRGEWIKGGATVLARLKLD